MKRLALAGLIMGAGFYWFHGSDVAAIHASNAICYALGVRPADVHAVGFLVAVDEQPKREAQVLRLTMKAMLGDDEPAGENL